jgi:hypothetical protein
MEIHFIASWTSPEGHLEKWLRDSKLDDEQVLERVFLTILSRRPTVKEREAIQSQLQKNAAGRSGIFQDVAWALMNSREFLYVH